MRLEIARIAALIRDDLERSGSTQEDYGRPLGLSQTKVSRLTRGVMPQMSAETLVALVDRFGVEAVLGSAHSLQSPPLTRPILQGLEADMGEALFNHVWRQVAEIWRFHKAGSDEGRIAWMMLMSVLDRYAPRKSSVDAALSTGAGRGNPDSESGKPRQRKRS